MDFHWYSALALSLISLLFCAENAAWPLVSCCCLRCLCALVRQQHELCKGRTAAAETYTCVEIGWWQQADRATCPVFLLSYSKAITTASLSSMSTTQPSVSSTPNLPYLFPFLPPVTADTLVSKFPCPSRSHSFPGVLR